MTTTTKKKRNRRTPEQIIADLEAKIADVKARATAKDAKKSPEAKAFLAAVKTVDKAIEAATEPETVRALEAARAPLGTRMIEMGLRAPVRSAASASGGKARRNHVSARQGDAGG